MLLLKDAKHMVCTIEIYEEPKLHDPVLIEGLPGIGFVANIAALHLIYELKAKRFAEILSDSFQDLVVTTETGSTRSPLNELYYYRRSDGGRDLIIWYGNTQALTTFGQYELCGHVLEIAEKLGCHYAITLGGFKKEEIKTPPEIYCAASDSETLNEVANLGAKIMVGQIFGVAGLIIGLGKIRGWKGFSLLVETLGTYPDANGARYALATVCKYLDLNIDFSRLDIATEKTQKILESFGLVKNVAEEKRKEEQRFKWFV